jgi:cellulose biosynthesis protein BcsQ
MMIALLNQKGGAGKSTIAVNLAAVAHLTERRRTLVLDLDPQGSAWDWFRARPKGSSLEGLDVREAPRARRPKDFAELSRGYDVVVCDCPARLDDVATAAALAADVVVVPLKPSGPDLWASEKTLDILNAADDRREVEGRQRARRFILLNMVEPNQLDTAYALDIIDREIVSKGLGELVPVKLGRRKAFRRSMAAGETALTRYTDAASEREIHELYSLLVGREVVARAA